MAGKQKKYTATVKPATEQILPSSGTGTGIPAWAPLIVVLLTGLIYSKAVNSGFTYIDDDYYIIRNQYLRDFSLNGIKAIFTHFYSFNYHPLTTISNLVEFHFWGLDPVPYHLFNVLFHLLNVWLVYKVTEALSGKGITALVVSILFAVHPMHVESVAWIAERKDVLYAAFYLGAIIFYLRYIDDGAKTSNYILSLLLFTCSLLSKSAAVTLPVLLVAIDLYRGRTINMKAIIEKVPFLLLSILFGILAIMSQKAGGAITDLSTEYSFGTRAILLLSGLSAYFIKLILPFGLSAIHYFPDLHGGALPWYYYLSIPFLAALGWLVARRSAYKKELLFGTVFFLITISVMLQFVTVGAAIYAERYTYISYIGLFYIIGQFVADKWTTKSANTVMGTFVAFAVVLSILSWERIGYWKNTDTLFADIIEHNKDNWRSSFVYYYWGTAKGNDGDHMQAANYYTKAIELKPDYERAYYNRGLTFDALHDTKAAIADYNKAIAMKPGDATLYNARGWAYFESGDKAAAIKDYNMALSLNPKLPEAYNNRGWTRFNSGDTAAALADYNQAILLVPTFTKPYYNRAIIAINTNNAKGAIDDYNTLIQMNPNDDLAYFSRGVARHMINDQGACNDLRKAAELGNRDAPNAIQQYCR